MSKYLKGWLMPSLVVLATYAFAQGGWYLCIPFFAAMAVFVVGDAILPRDVSGPPAYQNAFLLNLPLYLILPLLCAMNLVVFWLFGSGDPGGIGAWVLQHTGIDLFAARARSTVAQPDISPPPPTGAMKASRPLTWSSSSSAAVPCPAITAGSA